jgi:DNA mismatch repair protein MLH3
MSDIDARIRPLAPEVIAKIQSSVSITHLNEVILELVKNALDAGSTSVRLNVDYRRGGCSVEDDGHGIPAAEFEDGGGLGKAHSEFVYLALPILVADQRSRYL